MPSIVYFARHNIRSLVFARSGANLHIYKCLTKGVKQYDFLSFFVNTERAKVYFAWTLHYD